jgi:acyl-CoA thioesterase-1
MKKISYFVILVLTVCGFFPLGAMAEVRILALGDSLTEGFGVAEEEAFPYIVEQQLRTEGFDVKMINGGFSGATSASAPSRLKWYLRQKPHIMLLALGANDGLRGLDVGSMKENLSKAIEMAQAENVRVVMTGMQMPMNYGEEYTTAYRQAFFEVAEAYQLPMVPFLLQDVGGVRSLNLPDGIHPNPAGHKIMADTVLETLRPVVQQFVGEPQQG